MCFQQVILFKACGHEEEHGEIVQCDAHIKYLKSLPWHTKLLHKKDLVHCAGFRTVLSHDPNLCETCNARAFRQQRGLDPALHQDGKDTTQGQGGTGTDQIQDRNRSATHQDNVQRHLADLYRAASQVPGEATRSRSRNLGSLVVNTDYHSDPRGADEWEFRERDPRSRRMSGLHRSPAIRRTPSQEGRRRDSMPVRRGQVFYGDGGRQLVSSGLNSPPDDRVERPVAAMRRLYTTPEAANLTRPSTGSVQIQWFDDMKEYEEISKATREWAMEPATPPPSQASTPAAPSKVTPLLPDPLRVVKNPAVSDGRSLFQTPGFTPPCTGRTRPEQTIAERRRARAKGVAPRDLPTTPTDIPWEDNGATTQEGPAGATRRPSRFQEQLLDY